MSDEIAFVVYSVAAPAATAVCVAWLCRRMLPPAAAERYALPAALALGLLAGFGLLPAWVWLVPKSHWHWLPYLGLAGAAAGALPLRAISYGRWLICVPLALVAAWLLVPKWIEWSWPVAAACLSAYFLALMVLLDALPPRLLGRALVGLLATATVSVALLLVIGVSFTFGQFASIAAAAMAGCSIVSLRWPPADALPTSTRGLIPAFAILVGGLAFVGTIEPDPPLPAISIAPAAPLALWLFAAGPLARLQGRSALAAQVAAVLAPLVAAVGWVASSGWN